MVLFHTFSPLSFTPLQIDLGLANVPAVIEQISNAFGFNEEEVLKVKSLSTYDTLYYFFAYRYLQRMELVLMISFQP